MVQNASLDRNDVLISNVIYQDIGYLRGVMQSICLRRIINVRHSQFKIFVNGGG